uniref:Uncharacterized protein n=1 Tax=Rhizophora mucronata TaxID=61149 RepID=A0A2P2Q2N7_RHIMU
MALKEGFHMIVVIEVAQVGNLMWFWCFYCYG